MFRHAVVTWLASAGWAMAAAPVRAVAAAAERGARSSADTASQLAGERR